MNVREAVARWSLGLLPAEHFPSLASELLVAGHDGPALRELAGLHNPTNRDAGPLIDSAMAECGVVRQSAQTAIGILAWQIARQVVSREVSPYAGAHALCGLASSSETLPDLFAFYEYTDAYCGYVVQGRPDLDEEIRREAERFVQSHPELAA